MVKSAVDKGNATTKTSVHALLGSVDHSVKIYMVKESKEEVL
jgi:hypothetical protein